MQSFTFMSEPSFIGIEISTATEDAEKQGGSFVPVSVKTHSVFFSQRGLMCVVIFQSV